MKREDLDKKISRLLNEKETFLLSLIMLVHMKQDKDYSNLSDLIFLFDSYKGFKQFIKYYEGTTIEVPTTKEVKQALRLLDLFQKVCIDKKDFEEYYTRLKLNELGLSKDFCRNELDKFKKYLEQDGLGVLKQLRKLSKLK